MLLALACGTSAGVRGARAEEPTAVLSAQSCSATGACANPTGRVTVPIPPLLWYTRSATSHAVMTPLVSTFSNQASGAHGFIVGPLYHHADPDGSASALFPIYWRFHDAHSGATTQFLFPLGGVHHHPGARGALIGPAYGWSSSNGLGGWGAGLFPIAFFGRSGTRHHALLLPIFSHVSDSAAGTSTTGLAGLFLHRAPDGWDAGAIPLAFFGRHKKGTSYLYLPPFVWHRSRPEGTLDVVGPIYLERDRRGAAGQAPGWAGGVAPLVFFGHHGAESHQVVAPFFFHFANASARRQRLLAGPFFHRRDGDETADVLFPLFYLRRSPTGGRLVAPGVVWDRKDGRTAEAFGPFIRYTDARRDSDTWFLFPLVVHHSSPGYRITAQFPFFWRVHDGDEADTVLFPFYWRARSPERAVDAVFPLALHMRTHEARTTVVGPAWYRGRYDGGKSLGLFPLFAYGRSVKQGKVSSYFGLPGLYYAHNEHDGSHDFWAGLAYDFQRPERYDAGLIPLAFAWRRGTVSKLVAAPFIYHRADSAAEQSLTVVGPIYAGHNGPEHTFGLLPFLYVRKGDDGTSTTTLFPLFQVARKHDGSRLLTLGGGYTTYAGGWRAYLGTAYARHDREVTSAALWPIAYFMRKPRTHTRIDMVLPFLFDGRAGDGRELQAYGPLVWRYHSVEGSTVVGLPLFFDDHNYGESRTTALLPLFVHHRNDVIKSSSLALLPLLAWGRHRSGASPGYDAVWFPLVWRFGGHNPSTVVAPIFWDFVREDSRTTVVFPLWAHWRRLDHKGTLVLNVYHSKGIGPRAGAWYTDIVPLVQFGRPGAHNLEWSFLEGLFGYQRVGRNRKIKLLWLMDLPLQPVPESNLAWFGSTPSSARTEF